jgi:hypothetical protein
MSASVRSQTGPNGWTATVLRITRIALLALLGWSLVGVDVSHAAADASPAQQEAMLAAHNRVRQTVSAAETARLGQPVTIPDLTWDPAAAVVAQAWADALLAGNVFAHNATLEDFGENIFRGIGIDPATSAELAVSAWTAEAASYHWDTNTCDDVCTHYTQIVWTETTRVGCGLATDGTSTYWVCVYVPGGNLEEQQPYEPAAR